MSDEGRTGTVRSAWNGQRWLKMRSEGWNSITCLWHAAMLNNAVNIDSQHSGEENGLWSSQVVSMFPWQTHGLLHLIQFSKPENSVDPTALKG